MGVMLQVSFFKLIVISLLAFDLAVPGSGEYDISPSPDNLSTIAPIQGAMGPANQENSPTSNDQSPKLHNGFTMPPPLASPPVISSPLAPTIKGSKPSPSPSVSTPLLPPPVASSPPAPPIKGLEPSPSPSVSTPLPPPPVASSPPAPPIKGSKPSPSPSVSTPLPPPPVASSPPAPPIKGLEPSLSPSVLTPLPPQIVAPPSGERNTAPPPAGASPQKAPVIVASGVPPAQGPVLSTPFGDVPQHSPVTEPSVPPIANNKNESGVISPIQEPRAQVPVASPESGVSRNSSSFNPLPPAKAPSVIAETGRSPASAPLQKRNHTPFASPPSPALNPSPPLNHSPTKGTSHAMAPSKHSDTAPAPSLPSHHHEWSYSPASSPSTSFHRNYNAGKVIPPVANPPSKAPSTGKVITPSGNASAPYSSSSPSEGYSPTSPPSDSVQKHHFSRKPALSPTPGSFHVDISPTPTWQGPAVPPIILPRSMRRHNASPPSYPGPPISPFHFPVPSPISNTSPAPSPSPTAKSGHAKASPPNASPSSPKIPLLPPFHAFPPPPPNKDCAECSDPLTNTPPGAPCGCVQPMQVGLSLGVDLYTFFPLVSEFAAEVASGVFMKQSQVRIMGANAATEQPEKTVVLLDLVPMGQWFDNTTAFLTFERFWHKQIAINASIFGDYDVLYVRYPGLPPSPPLPPSEVGIIDDGPYSGNNNNGRTNKPLGVDVRGREHKHRLSGGVIAIIVLSILVAVVLCSVVAWILILKRREHVSQAVPAPQTLPPAVAKSSGIGGSILGSGPSSASLSFGSSIATYTGSAKTYGASDIERATNNFDSSRILGEGGFGRVYSGVFDDGMKVAVKVLKRDDQQGGREFLAEVEMLSRLHHRNLVKLMGICTEERARCLVYELIPNGSVESHLHGVDKETAPLDWAARMKIALGAARGLAYLHEDSSPRVIHRDFKSSNILLEQDFTPKVSDFGLARTALDEENRHISTRVMGTFGYVAPEYAMTGHLLVKSDVYSYGVVLLELLTGRKPVDMTQPPGQENLVAWARPLLTSKEGLEMIVDPFLGPDVPFDSVAKVAAIASMCVQPEVSHRPFMGEVVQALKLVCNECEEARGVGSRSSSRDDLSIDLEGRASSTSGQLPNPLHSQYSDSNFASGIDAERGLSVSELLSTSAGYERQVSGSFRRHSSSGPLRTGRGPHFWQRFRMLSGGSVSEHGAFLRLWPGSQ